MGIIRKVLAWRGRHQSAFDTARDAVSLETRIGAAEYELRQISRDVNAVLLDQSQIRTLTRVNFTV